nr:MAG: hypothetical protein DIU57_20655 [Pseudomonadota bacterium]
MSRATSASRLSAPTIASSCAHLLFSLSLRSTSSPYRALEAADTPVPVLEPGRGKTKTGRLWVYVRDDRPAGSKEASALFFRYSRIAAASRPKSISRTSTASCTPTLTPDSINSTPTVASSSTTMPLSVRCARS